MTAPTPTWWKVGTAYQIWPASYKDSNGDGVGDIPGIISTIPYLQSLGVDIIWLSPMYASPNKDMGYDISNYEDVHPDYGTLQDMEKLIEECHSRNMKLILDLVVNHTSDQHAWFKESRKSRDNEYSDWYIWKDPKMINGERHPPNNWRAIFGGSAWEYVPERDQYYLHLFVPEQPDLNWENETTRRGIYKSAIAFWLDRGVDGFRVDTVNLYSKDTSYPDASTLLQGEQYQPASQYYANGPRMHEWLKEQRREVLDKYGDVLMVGELPGTEFAEVLKYVSAESRELSCVFDFDVVSLGGRHGDGVKKHQIHPHTLPEFKEAIRKVQDLIRGTDAWTTAFLENHDQGRSLSRFATDSEQYRAKAAKMLALLLCSLTGTLFIYQGQEIGMTNHPVWPIEDIRDIDSLNGYKEIAERHNNDPLWLQKALKGIQKVGRDNARTPVQWSGDDHAGFTTGSTKPWIRVNDNYRAINVAAQEHDAASPLNFWKKALQLRKEYTDLMVFGTFEVWDRNDTDVFTFVKESGRETGSGAAAKDGPQRKLLVFLNFSDDEQPMHWPPGLQDEEGKAKLLVANVDDLGKYLSPWEARAYLVE